ncbi:MAG: hypothetical protein JSS40_08655 [Proteobacteria bacterium]|nr:hypothetical protein [Pseudomonadota bacterium]
MPMRPLIAAALALAAGSAFAHKPTVQECREAGEFIRNAALARDAGMPREAFLDRLLGDLVAIRAHPPELRWFAQDVDDEVFLVAAVERVFDAPMKSTEHESEMLGSCLVRAGIV